MDKESEEEYDQNSNLSESEQIEEVEEEEDEKEPVSEDFDLDEEDDEDEEYKPVMKKKRTKKETQREGGRKKLKQKRDLMKKYVEMEPDVVDEDEEELNDEDNLDIEKNQKIQAELRKMENEAKKRLDERKKKNEELINKIEERFRYDEEEGEFSIHDQESGELEEIHQEVSIGLPTINDPSIWLVKVKPGKEREATVSLHNKALEMKKLGKPTQIISVINMGRLHGYIYVEAFKEAHVRNAIDGLHSIFQSKIRKVALEEYNSIFLMSKEEKPILKKGDWVRVKSGIYGGDLAQVFDALPNKAFVRLIPRINPLIEENKEIGIPEKTRIIQRKFDSNEVKNAQTKHDRFKGLTFYIWNNQKFRKGFLYKDLNIRSLITSGVTPTIEELEKFKPTKFFSVEKEESEEEEEEDELDKITLLSIRNSNFLKGDRIQVISGELTGQVGIILSKNEDNLLIKPENEKLSTFNVSTIDVMKYFLKGENVIITNGENKGEKGLITAIEKNVIVLYSNVKQSLIKANANDVQLISAFNSAYSSNATKYSAYDIISFNNNKNVGLILSIEKDMIKVIDCSGSIQRIQLSAVNSRQNTDKNIALDSQNHTINKYDKVQVVDGIGPNKGKKGEVKHIYKNYVFIYNPQENKNTFGIFIEQARNISLLGSSLLPSQGQMRNKMPMNPKRDSLIGTIPQIKDGQYKGLFARIADATEKNYRVELIARNKVVTIEKELITGESTKVDNQSGIQSMNEIMKTPAYVPMSPHYTIPNESFPSWNNSYEMKKD